jgi:hypothetical protein
MNLNRSASDERMAKILSAQPRHRNPDRAKKWVSTHLPDVPPYVIVGTSANNLVALARHTWGSNREMSYKSGDTFLWYESAPQDDHKGGARGLFAVGEFTTDIYERQTKLWPDGVYPYRIGIKVIRYLGEGIALPEVKQALAPDASNKWRFIRRDRQLSAEEWAAIRPLIRKTLLAN